MLYILHSPPLPLPTRLPLFIERPHTQYLLCVIGLLIFELLRLSLWACRFVVVVRVCLTCPLCVHIVFIVIHAGLLLSLVASIFNIPSIDLESRRQVTHNSHNYCPVRKPAQCVFLFRGLGRQPWAVSGRSK